jgi:excisionase family DNA binding protein
MTTTPDQLPKPRSEQLLTVAQVADRLQVSRNTIYILIRRGDLTGIRVSDRKTRVRQADFDRYLERHRLDKQKAKVTRTVVPPSGQSP